MEIAVVCQVPIGAVPAECLWDAAGPITKVILPHLMRNTQIFTDRLMPRLIRDCSCELSFFSCKLLACGVDLIVMRLGCILAAVNAHFFTRFRRGDHAESTGHRLVRSGQGVDFSTVVSVVFHFFHSY